MTLATSDTYSFETYLPIRSVHIPHALSERAHRILETRIQIILAELRRHRNKGLEISDIGCVAVVASRDAAVCAKALLIEHGIIRASDASIGPSAKSRYWRVAGAWSDEVKAKYLVRRV